MRIALAVELLLAFIIFCADSIDRTHSLPNRLLRAILWPSTLYLWFTHWTVPKLLRASAIVWFITITGWLAALESDRHASWLIPITLAFTVWCRDQMSVSLQNSLPRRIARAICAPYTLTLYFQDEDGIKLQHSILIIWGFLTTGWMITLGLDRLF